MQKMSTEYATTYFLSTIHHHFESLIGSESLFQLYTNISMCTSIDDCIHRLHELLYPLCIKMIQDLSKSICGM
jgi:hypothetical protein